MKKNNPLQLKSLNHVSIVCRSTEKSLDFYQHVLGFFPIKRPGSFDFSGAWLFNYGIGIHLVQSENPDNMPKVGRINPKNNHISFQCECMGSVEKRLKEMKIEYVKGGVEEGGIRVEQLFFHDPDGTMIEVCDCDNLPVVPLLPAALDHDHHHHTTINASFPPPYINSSSCNLQQLQQQQQQQQSNCIILNNQSSILISYNNIN